MNMQNEILIQQSLFHMKPKSLNNTEDLLKQELMFKGGYRNYQDHIDPIYDANESIKLKIEEPPIKEESPSEVQTTLKKEK